MQQLYICRQQHGSKYFIRYNINMANIACNSSIHHLFNSYITYRLHVIITSSLKQHVSSSQITLNIIKSLISYPKVISQGHMRLQVANRTGWKICHNSLWQVGLLASRVTTGPARYGELGLLASRALGNCSLWRAGLLASRAI